MKRRILALVSTISLVACMFSEAVVAAELPKNEINYDCVIENVIENGINDSTESQILYDKNGVATTKLEVYRLFENSSYARVGLEDTFSVETVCIATPATSSIQPRGAVTAWDTSYSVSSYINTTYTARSSSIRLVRADGHFTKAQPGISINNVRATASNKDINGGSLYYPSVSSTYSWSFTNPSSYYCRVEPAYFGGCGVSTYCYVFPTQGPSSGWGFGYQSAELYNFPT